MSKASSTTKKRYRKVSLNLKINLNYLSHSNKRRSNKPARIIKENPHKINEKITANEIRLVGDNVEVGVYRLPKAIALPRNWS